MNGGTGMGERIFSVDDLVGGIWRLGQAASGFHRTDSEAAFQEFLKRIPSASNLATAATQMDPASAAQLQQQHHQQQHHQQFQQQQQQQEHHHHISRPIAGIPPPMDVNMAGGMGMHRVPSLDFLKQLSAMQQMAGTQQGVKLEMSTPPPGLVPSGITAFTSADLSSLNSNGMTQALSVPALNTFNAKAAANAAALQLNQLSRYNPVAATSNGRSGRSGHTSDPDSSNDNDKDTYDKNDPRKAKSRANRMLSNRESARRSRRRKQEHLGKLEIEINILLEDKKVWTDRVAALERSSGITEEANKRMQEENERLKDELLYLRTELTEKKTNARKESHEEAEELPDSAATKRQKLDS